MSTLESSGCRVDIGLAGSSDRGAGRRLSKPLEIRRIYAGFWCLGRDFASC